MVSPLTLNRASLNLWGLSQKLSLMHSKHCTLRKVVDQGIYATCCSPTILYSYINTFPLKSPKSTQMLKMLSGKIFIFNLLYLSTFLYIYMTEYAESYALGQQLSSAESSGHLGALYSDCNKGSC